MRLYYGQRRGRHYGGASVGAGGGIWLAVLLAPVVLLYCICYLIWHIPVAAVYRVALILVLLLVIINWRP